ncbi:MAG: class I SAM-dependent methyltransferase [Anaerolineales bacterium]
MTKDYFWLHLRDLPYFRALLRSIEAGYYEGLDLPSPTLDVGCGDGHFTTIAFDRSIEIGVDPDLPIMREAQLRNAYDLLLQADGACIPLPDHSIASAFSNSVLEHIPHLDAVLQDVGRVLKPGAPFVFTVPNPGYRTQLSFPQNLAKAGLSALGKSYSSWFMRMSRTINLEYEEDWEQRLSAAGFTIERTFRYFPPSSLHVLEWGHYFGGPCLLPHKLFGKWILAPYRWNLGLTDWLVRRYYDTSPTKEGTYSFYLVRRR